MNILKTLNSPLPVARFQYVCGVRWKNPDQQRPLFPIDQPSSSENTVANYSKNEFFITNRLIFFLAKAGSELAGEPFYYVFFPSCAWIFKIRLARRTLMMLAASMYVGQSLKDYLKQPRPASPPVIRLDEMYETEYGMPSTHTLTGVTVSFSLLLFSSQFYQVPILKGIMLASAWSSSVMISRVYLGMHSLLETLVGALLSFTLLGTFYPVINWFEEVDLNANYTSSICIGASSLLLSKIMFMLDSGINEITGQSNWNTARGDTAEILGWCAGFLIGSKYAISAGILSAMSSNEVKNLLPLAEAGQPALQCTLRFSAGAFILLPVTFLLRKSLLHLLISVNGISNVDLQKAKRISSVELPYKFFSALFSGCLSTLVVPAILQHLNLW